MSRPITANENETPSVPRSYSLFQCTRRWPRRYIMAFLLSLLSLIEYWKNFNIVFTVVSILYRMEHDDRLEYNSIRNWTVSEVQTFLTTTSVLAIFVQIPGALLIFIISSYKYLAISVAMTSIIHMLIPVALRHHTISLLLLLMSQTIIGAPLKIAALSMWKDWAPPMERTKLMTFSFLGQIISTSSIIYAQYFIPLLIADYSYYLSGTAGLIWALFWFCAFSDTPPNDPMISESEHVYLEGTIPSRGQERLKVRDVPWKSILTSKPVIILCLIFFKMSYSFQAISTGGVIYSHHLTLSDYNSHIFFTPFFLGFLILPSCSAILADYLIRKHKDRILSIRKHFLCIGFSLQIILFFGILSSSPIVDMICFLLSYLCFAVSLSGFITIALDLSPRYVTIIAGLIYTFYNIAVMCYSYLAKFSLEYGNLSLAWTYVFEGILSAVCIALFFYYGDVEEQSWSYISFRSPVNGSMCYPRREDEDNSNLVTEDA